MTDWDYQLINDAMTMKYWRYQVVFDFVDLAETSKAKYTLDLIARLLFDMYQDRGMPLPKKEKRRWWRRRLACKASN